MTNKIWNCTDDEKTIAHQKERIVELEKKLAENDAIIETLKKELGFRENSVYFRWAKCRMEELERKLTLIGERAVVDFDNETAEMVTKAVPKVATYKDWVREVMSEYIKIKGLERKLAATKNLSYVCSECGDTVRVGCDSLNSGTTFKCDSCGQDTIVNLMRHDDYCDNPYEDIKILTDKVAQLERELGIRENSAHFQWAKQRIAELEEKLAEAQIEMIRLIKCMYRAGLECFIKNGTPEKIAEHMHSVAMSNCVEMQRMECELEQAQAEVAKAKECQADCLLKIDNDKLRGELAQLKDDHFGVRDEYMSKLDEQEAEVAKLTLREKMLEKKWAKENLELAADKEMLRAELAMRSNDYMEIYCKKCDFTSPMQRDSQFLYRCRLCGDVVVPLSKNQRHIIELEAELAAERVDAEKWREAKRLLDFSEELSIDEQAIIDLHLKNVEATLKAREETT